MARYQLPLAIALVVFALFVVTSTQNRGGPAESELEMRPGMAPDISIKARGGDVSLSSLKGKVVLVDFWATWCGPCAMSIPGIEALYRKHQDRGFAVMGVAMENDGGGQVPGYVSRMRMTYPVGLPGSVDQVKPFLGPGTGIPFMVVVDRKGKIRFAKSGFSPEREQELGELVDQLLNER